MADSKVLDPPVRMQERSDAAGVTPSPATSPSTRRGFAVYCLALMMVPLVWVAASLLIARSSWFLRHERNSYLTISDYTFTLQNVNCDLVIYGDSSALTGVAPQVIEDRTALRTCNIAQPNTALAIVGTFALDAYLLHNTRPKFLIFQFTAPDFAPLKTDGRLFEEGALQLVRHKLDGQTLRRFARHPLEFLNFSEFILRSALFERDAAAETYERTWAKFRASNGLFTAPGAPLGSCVGDLEVREPDAAFISRLREKYSQGDTRVLVYAAPYPECDKSYGFYAQRLKGISDSPLPLFDIHYFNEKNHFTRAGAELNSERIAEEIRKLRQP